MGKITEGNVKISNRLKTIEELLGLNPIEMADIGGCSQATYYRYRRGESMPDSLFLNNIISYDNSIRAEWLLMGYGPILSRYETEASMDSDEPLQPKFINIPLYEMEPTEESSEGQLSLKEWENSSATLPLCKIFIDGFLEKSSDHLFAMRIGCDSMSPEIKPESLVLVNRDKTNISSDGIYVIQFGNVVRMKLLQELPDNKLLLTTINKKYDPVEVNRDSIKDFEILGKIVWVGTPI